MGSCVVAKVGSGALTVIAAAGLLFVTGCGDSRAPPIREDFQTPESMSNGEDDDGSSSQVGANDDEGPTESDQGEPDPAPALDSDGDGGLPADDDDDAVVDAGTSVNTILTHEPPCSVQAADAGTDNDGDGFSVKQGDCNDCTLQINPGAYDFPGNAVDEDCNGELDDEPSCDTAAPDPAESSALIAARSIGICRRQQGDSWGLVRAEYVLASGGTAGVPELSHGLLTSFGPRVTPREGDSMLALSSGTARQPGDEGFLSPIGAEMGTSTATPDGFPLPSPSCPNAPSSTPIANDSIGLRLVIRVPSNANQFQFDFDFYTYEFPYFICSEFNDFFAVLMDPPPTGAIAGNVSFDAQDNPVSVNNGFLEVCDPQTAGGKAFACELGASELEGTGFEGAAATGWVQTTSPALSGSEITLTFLIWDAGDHVLDSTVLIDHFRWTVGTGIPFTERGPAIMDL